MTHRIGKSEKVSNFNTVFEIKIVEEEDFYKQLKESIASFNGNDSKTEKLLERAKGVLKTGKSVTIEEKYFIIKHY